MTVRTILRRANRGLALAAVALLALVGYLVFDTVRFAGEKDIIRAMASQYAAASGELLILPAQQRVPGQKTSDEAVSAKLKESQAVINRFLADSQGPYAYRSARRSALQSLERALKENAEAGAYVTSCQTTVKPITKIKKNGPDYAVADITVQVEASMIGKPVLFALMDTHYTDDAYYTKDGTRDDVIDATPYTYTWEYSINGVQFQKIGGQWKIIEYGYTSYYDSGRLVAA